MNRYFFSLGYTNINANKKPWCEGPYGRETQSIQRHQPSRNMLTTDATARLLTEIATGQAVSARRSAEMLELLKREPFKKIEEGSEPDQGTAFGGRTFAWYSIVCFIVAFILPLIAKKTGRKFVHAVALLAGGIGLISTGFIHDRFGWQCTMIGVGIAWASILAMPYAMLSGALPAERMGVYMGIFNFFIVIPEILASLALEPIVKNVFGNDPVKVVMLGGASMLIAAATVFRVKDVGAVADPDSLADATPKTAVGKPA